MVCVMHSTRRGHRTETGVYWMMFSLFGCGLVGEGVPNKYNRGLVGRVIRARETAVGGIVSAETRMRDFCARGTAAKRAATLTQIMRSGVPPPRNDSDEGTR